MFRVRFEWDFFRFYNNCPAIICKYTFTDQFDGRNVLCLCESPEFQFYYVQLHIVGVDGKSHSIGHASCSMSLWCLKWFTKFSGYLYHQIDVKWKQSRQASDNQIKWVAMVSFSYANIVLYTWPPCVTAWTQWHLNMPQNNNNMSPQTPAQKPHCSWVLQFILDSDCEWKKRTYVKGSGE